ncbi:hypothetical protein [Desulfobulbus sp.]|uniref:Orn/Lys/Arg family decarboxylase n=1 Tax=Desulfobulbus sp. TaxID=895 RepID=UPI00286F5249|nr:hypothetical protein [Desulfobulbus sp.]
MHHETNNRHKRRTLDAFLDVLRASGIALPPFLSANPLADADLPPEALAWMRDFIRLHPKAAPVAGRDGNLLPPLFTAIMAFQGHEYAWHTPGHAGGNAFLKSPAGRAFYHYFGESLLRSDFSISVGRFGSLLDHSGPMGESERYLARVFGSHRSYHVTSGSSESNRIILAASVARGQIVLVDRNCHKSVKHGIVMANAIPVYLPPSRNRYGMIGPICPEHLAPETIAASIAQNALAARATDSRPVHAIVTNPTYDGLIYNVARVEELLGRSVDRLHFDEAWFGYARFHPLYAGRFAMHGDPRDHGPAQPTVFAVQSTHKLLTALSQASMIHVRDGRNPVEHARFNESFMMHATTSPLYPIIVSNEVSAAIMDGRDGQALLTGTIAEAVAFRQAMARLHADFAAQGQWFFNCWQPDRVRLDGKSVSFAEVPTRDLQERPELWTLAPEAQWHGFTNFPADYVMLDPIKVTVTTPGIGADGGLEQTGIPAPLVAAYLNARGIVPEKSANFTLLFLFSVGIAPGQWQTLTDALLAFKKDYDADAPLDSTIPELARVHVEYAGFGLRDLGESMFRTMAELRLTELMAEAFAQLPRPVMTPAAAYEKLVRNEVASRSLSQAANQAADCVAATGIAPYPPGIPMLMPGESLFPEPDSGPRAAPVLRYLQALEAFDRRFPGFGHETHGVAVEQGTYRLLCVQ